MLLPDAPSEPRGALGRVVWWSALILAVAFGCGHAVLVSRYLDRINHETFQAPPSDASGRNITLGVAADGRTWLRLTEERIAHGDWRFGRTVIDGGPEGREVYWHSAWSWWLETLGRMRATWTGETLPRAIEAASVWAQLPVWLTMVCGGGWWAARQWGRGAATIFVVTLAGHRGLYVACYPGYPDHHGAIVATALGTLLGLISGVFGNRSGRDEQSASKWIWISALSGAAGLALSAASLVPVLLGIGLIGLLTRNGVRRSLGEEAIRRAATRWRLWGRVGAAAALGLHLLEFFPNRFAWRLEVNHPVYALAWWGGGEFLAWWWSRGNANAPARRRRDWLVPAAALFAVSAPVLVFAVGGGAVFSPVDEFIARVHRHITEFHPLWRMSGSSPWLLVVSMVPLAMVPWAWKRLRDGDRMVLCALALLAGLLLGLSVLQHRWWSLAAVAQAPLAALVGAAFVSRPREWRCVAATVLLAVITLPGPVMLIVEQVRVARARDVQAADAMQLLYRDVAWSLASATTGRRPVLLSAPEPSVSVGYYGDLRTPGTLYWENGDGLRIAARVLSATDDDAAAHELQRAGVTHLLLIAPGDFTVQYLDALTAAGARSPAAGTTLGRRLSEGRGVPAWARALPYEVPPQFGRLGVRVALYAFAPGLGLAESRHALGVARLVAGDESAGRAALREAARLGSPEASLVLAWRLATTERLSPAEAEDAVNLAAGAVASLPEAAAHRRVLAACYAAARRWPEAQATVLRALDLAQEAGDARAVAELERDFVLYRDSRPPHAAPAGR